MEPVLRRFSRLGLWMTAVPVAIFLMPEGPAVAATMMIVISSLVISGRALRRQTDIPAGFPSIYAGGLALMLAMVVRGAHASVAETSFPYPSPADILAILGYVLTIAGAISLARSRRAFGGQRDAIDVLILAVAVAGPFWIGVLGEYFSDDSFSVAHRMLSGVYALTEVAFAAVVLRLATGPGLRPRSYWTLAASLTAITFTDAVAILDTIGGPGGSLLPPIAALGFITFASTCRSDDIHRLVERPPATDPRLTTSRLATLTVAMAMIPILIGLQQYRGNANSSLTITFVVVLSVLILIRVVGLLRSRDRIAEFDATLREAGRILIAADSVAEVTAVLESALPAVSGADSRAGVVLRTPEGACLSITMKSGGSPFVIDEGRWGPESDEEQLSVHLGPAEDPALVTRVELGEGGLRGLILVVPEAPLQHANQLAIQTLASQITMALQSLELREITFRERSEQRLSALVEQSADVVTVVDGTTITFISPNSDRVLGLTTRSVIQTDFLDLVHPDDHDRVERHLSSPAPSGRTPLAIEARIFTAGGDHRWFDITARDFRDDSEVSGTVITARDVNEERAAKLGLLRSEQWFRGLVQNSSDVIAVLDEVGLFTYVSPAVELFLGHDPKALQGRNIGELLPKDEPEQIALIRREIDHTRVGSRTVELTLERADGDVRDAEVTISDLRSDPSVNGLVLNIRDITDRKRLEQDLRHQVLTDDLTGLGSRVQFTEQLATALGAERRPGSNVAVLFIDVDDFKTVNDSLGHAAGDQVLVEISSRLQGKLRLNDRAARFGGDEFAVLLTDVYGDGDVTLVADRVVEELSKPVMLMEHEIRLSASVGIASDFDGSQTPEDLLRAADVAMYVAKGNGKGCWRQFETGMADSTVERFEIVNTLGAAIDNDELAVHYQPIVDLTTGLTHGVEALVRWAHPVRGMVSPGSFIPLAESNGLIVPLGRAVLKKAVRQMAEWRDKGHDLYVSVNISPIELQNETVVSEILTTVDSAGLSRSALVLELTESALINDFEVVVNRINELRAAGIRVAIDDFGTGYATLKYAEEFSADILKVDQSFVAKLEHQEYSTIVATVLALAESMGAETVAEGIEVPVQHTRLIHHGCRLGQGYYFRRPAPPDTIGELLAAEANGEALIGHAH